MKRLVCATSLMLLIGCRPYDQELYMLADPNFSSWCGESLCSWKTEQGRIRRVGTWDRSDYGVELASTPSIISQEANLDARDSFHDPESGLAGLEPCMKLTILGEVEAEAEVRLELDFFSDGSVDYEDSVPGVAWKRIDLLVRFPSEPFSSMKVSLHKHGVGKATFARLAAVGVSNCRGEPIELLPRTLGSVCSTSDDCESKRCDTSSSLGFGTSWCAECLSAADCKDGLICAVVNETDGNSPFLGCVSRGGTPTGLGCNDPEQCETGRCVERICGECRSEADCAGGDLCGIMKGADGGPYRACVPPGSVATGDYCRTGAECASGTCSFICLDPD